MRKYVLATAMVLAACGPQTSSEIGTRPVEAHEIKRELPLPPFPDYPPPAIKLTEESEGVIYYPIKSPYDFSRCLLYTSPSPRDKRQSRMPSSA